MAGRPGARAGHNLLLSSAGHELALRAEILAAAAVRFGVRCSGGLSLLEILLVSALLTLLMTLAVPAYRHHAMRAYRVEARVGSQVVARGLMTGFIDPHHAAPDGSASAGFGGGEG